ncbi:MAG: hypothetical protein IT340_15000 [Chloroflexi bacterium]|nr:hypothetical protein [Chloroflexota bacterium]
MTWRENWTSQTASATVRSWQPSSRVWSRALAALIRLDPPVAVALATDPTLTPRTRVAIAVGLGRVHHPAGPELLGALATDAALPDLVRARAASTLALIAPPAAIALVQDDVVAPLTRLAATATLARGGHGAAVLPVARALAKDERQPPVRRIEAAAVLLRHGDEATTRLVLHALVGHRPAMVAALLARDAPATAVAFAGDAAIDDRARVVIMKALARHCEPTATIAPGLAALARDPAALVTVQRLAMLVLTGLGRRGTRPTALSEWAYRTEAWANIWMPRHLLTNLRAAQQDRLSPPPASIPYLAPLATAATIEPLGRILAADALARQGQVALALPVLRDLATGRRTPVAERLVATDALARWGQPDDAAPLLAELAADRRHDPVVRLGAIDALVRLGRRAAAITHLRSLLTEPGVKNDTRASAARRLIRLGHDDQAAIWLDPSADRWAAWSDRGDWPD